MALVPALAAATIRDVTISNLRFSPASVTITLGDTIRWTNMDVLAHTSTSDSGLWDSGPLAQNDTFMRAFPTAGTFPYHCILHPLMTATIVAGTQSSIDEEPLTPDQFRLEPNFPNPFNSGTKIAFVLGSDGAARLEIYDAVGRKVETLMDGSLGAGRHAIAWEAGNRPSGLYFYHLTFGGQLQTGRMTLLK
jgi:plastocyanin